MKKFLSVFLLLIFTAFTFSSPVFAEDVIFNTESKKVHKVTCPSAKKCTKNCVKIERKDAYSHGGKPCKLCGG